MKNIAFLLSFLTLIFFSTKILIKYHYFNYRKNDSKKSHTFLHALYHPRFNSNITQKISLGVILAENLAPDDAIPLFNDALISSNNSEFVLLPYTEYLISGNINHDLAQLQLNKLKLIQKNLFQTFLLEVKYHIINQNFFQFLNVYNNYDASKINLENFKIYLDSIFKMFFGCNTLLNHYLFTIDEVKSIQQVIQLPYVKTFVFVKYLESYETFDQGKKSDLLQKINTIKTIGGLIDQNMEFHEVFPLEKSSNNIKDLLQNDPKIHLLARNLKSANLIYFGNKENDIARRIVIEARNEIKNYFKILFSKKYLDHLDLKLLYTALHLKVTIEI